jgi:outer membrane protein assembly factor BamB
MKQLPSILFMSSMLLAPGIFPAARAVETGKVNHDTFAGFSPGEFDNVSLTSDGHLELAPAMTNVATLTDPIIWSAVEDAQGTVFLGTGNQGKVYKLNPKGELSVFFAPNEVMVHALALDHKGRLYAATSPNGRVYRFDAEGQAEVYCSPGETYIWAMTFGKDDTLFLATGNHGKILRVSHTNSTPAKAETCFESEENHISALALDKDGNLLAGTSPHGYLYRIDKANHGFVLFNSGDTEIKQIAVAGDGTIYVSTFVEGPQQKASLSPFSSGTLIVPMGGGDATSRDSSARAGAPPNIQPPAPVPGESGPSIAQMGAEAGPSTHGPGGMPAAGVLSRGAVYRIDTAGFHERYWASADDAIYSMVLLRDGRLLVGTGDKGRIYCVSDLNHWQLLQKTSDGAQVSALLPGIGESKQYYAATSHPGWLCRLDFALATNGTYTSKVFDAKQKSLWGRIHPEADVPAGTRLEFSTRSGNTDKPEKTWSDWSPATSFSSEIGVSNPPARYLQYRVLFGRNSKSTSATPELRRVRFYYQNQNAAPVISRISVHTEGFSVSKMPQPVMDPPMNLEQLLGGGRMANPMAPPKPPLKVTRGPGLCTVAWEASDPNQDQLDYSVSIRSEHEKEWTTLVAKSQETFFSFDTTGFHEGFYYVKVAASDEPSNPPEIARTTEETSEAFLIDNTPPVLTVKSQQIDKNRARIGVEAVDGASVIESASYSLDGKDEVAVRPETLIFDSTREKFVIELTDLINGPHSLLFRAADEAGNASVLKLNFNSP